MTITDLVGIPRPKDDEFDENEAKDLSLHVRQCGRRYRELDRKVSLQTRLIVIGFLIMYASGAPGVIKALAGWLLTP